MIAAIIVAAGQGLRMGTSQRKQFLRLGQLPILGHTLKVFDDSQTVDSIVLVIPENEEDFCRREILEPARISTPVKMVRGGRRRQDSVLNGLKFIDDPEAVVLIHDGVRPMLSLALIDACVEGAKRWGACVPALPVVDTLKKADREGRICRTVDRSDLYAAQTPQAYKLSLILAAHEAEQAQDCQATDDASLVEAMGQAVHVIRGERENIKITTTEDLELARIFLHARQLLATADQRHP